MKMIHAGDKKRFSEFTPRAPSNGIAACAAFRKEHASMKQVIRILLIAMALGASGAYAQSAYPDSHSKYDSQSAEGNSANWGVGSN
jgi:hypothetical protein